jgi:hypothetical protein
VNINDGNGQCSLWLVTRIGNESELRKVPDCCMRLLVKQGSFLLLNYSPLVCNGLSSQVHDETGLHKLHSDENRSPDDRTDLK